MKRLSICTFLYLQTILKITNTTSTAIKNNIFIIFLFELILHFYTVNNFRYIRNNKNQYMYFSSSLFKR